MSDYDDPLMSRIEQLEADIKGIRTLLLDDELLELYYQDEQPPPYAKMYHDSLETIEQLQATQQWISVSERLPENDIDCWVLTYHPDRAVEIIKWYQSRWRGCDGLDDDNPTHWMPLPQPPEFET